MAERFQLGDCVELPDGRIGRVRGALDGGYRVRVRRHTSKTHQFVTCAQEELKSADCPKGWMRPEAYVRYLEVTLAKMGQRRARGSRS